MNEMNRRRVHGIRLRDDERDRLRLAADRWDMGWSTFTRQVALTIARLFEQEPRHQQERPQDVEPRNSRRDP
jgi:hypothetical protein